MNRFTAEARALVAFVLATALVTGLISQIALPLGSLLSGTIGGNTTALFAALLALISGVVFLFARGTGVPDQWSGHLGQAAALLALIAVGLNLLKLVAALVNDGMLGSQFMG